MGGDILTIVGVGLIGGSLGLSARGKGLFREVRGTTRHHETLQAALAAGAIDTGFADAVESARGAHVVVVATSVGTIPGLCLSCAEAAADGALITDVGSVKATIVDAVESEMPEGRTFIGSHPIAGSEKRGVVNATDDLLSGATCVITPTESSPAGEVERLRAFWESLEMNVTAMTPEAHDMALALVSHLPHVAASALIEAIPDDILPLGASGLRDTTRVAAGDAALWRDILMANGTQLAGSIDTLIEQLGLIRNLVAKGDSDGIEKYLADAARRREQRFGDSSEGGGG